MGGCEVGPQGQGTASHHCRCRQPPPTSVLSAPHSEHPPAALAPAAHTQVIHMLKGVATPGPALQLDPVRGAYAPTPGVHLHSSSHGAARALLARFAEAATAVRRVQAFCAAAVAGGSVASAAAAAQGSDAEEEAERRLHALPTVAAFAAAVAEQQQGLQRQVLVLEAAAASGALTSLLQLQQRTAGLAQQAALLAALLRRCCVWRGSPAETAAGLLSGLHEALQLQLMQARSQGEAGTPARHATRDRVGSLLAADVEGTRLQAPV